MSVLRISISVIYLCAYIVNVNAYICTIMDMYMYVYTERETNVYVCVCVCITRYCLHKIISKEKLEG